MKRLLTRLSFAFVCVALSEASVEGATHSVVVSGFTFSPSTININVGDTVTWTGLVSFHTVTPNAGVTEPFCGNTVQNSCTATFNTAGSFGYHCNPHQGIGMVGVVNVAAVNLPPTASITNLVSEQIIITPGPLSVLAAVNDPDGSIAHVLLMTNGVRVYTNTAPPFGNLVLTNIPSARFAMRVIAVDNQGALVNSGTIFLRPAPRPALVFQRGTNGPLQLQFNSVSGISYVVEQSLALTNFTPVTTISNNGGVLQFSETNSSSTQKFIRVRLQ